MQIFVRQVTGADGIKEWALIELQGELENRSMEGHSGKFVGDLHYTTDGTPILIIGHHILHGKEQKLEKSFAVLDKKSEPDEKGQGRTEYVIRAIIKKKISFRERPKPIVSTAFRKI